MTIPLGERCIKFADRRKNAVVEENKKEFINPHGTKNSVLPPKLPKNGHSSML